MNPSDEGELQSKTEDTKFQDEFQKGPQAPETPLVPMIPDDIDDSDDNLPLITSVFSLASSDELDSPEKKRSPNKDSPKETKATQAGSPSKTSHSPTDNVKLTQSSSFRVNPKPSAAQVNAPFYLGKAKLLPKTEEGKMTSPPQNAGMTFSKMVSIQPIATSAKTANTTDGTKSSTSVLTRGTLKKMDLTTTSGHITGNNVATSVTSGSPMINLSTSVPFLNAQIAVPPLNVATPASNSSVTNPLVQMVKRIAPATTVMTPSQSSTVVKSLSTFPKSKPLVTPAVKQQQQKPRHVNIAPAPSNSQVFVVVTKTLSPPTTTNTTVTTNPVGSNIPRVVTATKPFKPAPVPVSPGQLMYLIENKTADGKIFRFLIPTDNAKIVTNPSNNVKTITVVTSKAPPLTPSATPPATATTSPSQPIRIIPKPVQATVPTQTSQTQTTTVSAVTSSIPAPDILSSSTPAPVLKPGTSNPVINTSRPVALNTGTPPVIAGNVTPPESTSPATNTSPITDEDSICTPPISPAPAEESSTNDDSIDTGLSPHEARIQKLKDLLRKQEDAVNRIREKRKKEIDDVRAAPSSDTNSNKRDSIFAVPLPPKKARYEQYKRNKNKETSTQTSKDGFLPNTDDTHFVKLVGLEKVVDKIKAKKILELSEHKVSE